MRCFDLSMLLSLVGEIVLMFMVGDVVSMFIFGGWGGFSVYLLWVRWFQCLSLVGEVVSMFII